MTLSRKTQQEWVVAGIRHEIFMRVFPSLRHALVSPISISRMSVSIVRRLLAKGEASKAALNEPVERMDQQLAEAVVGIRALQAWEPGAKGTETPAEILHQGISLMTARLALRDIKLDYVPADILDVTEVPHQSFLYAWLALLCYFEDSLQEPVTLHITQTLPKAVSVQVMRPLYDANQVKSRPVPTGHMIDQTALDIIAVAGALHLELDHESVIFSWAELN